MKETKKISARTVLIWCVSLTAIYLAFVFSVKRQAKVGSTTSEEMKYADCTNQIITIPVKEMPRAGISLLLAVPDEFTNSVLGVSGAVNVQGKLTIGGRVKREFVITPASSTWEVQPLKYYPEAEGWFRSGEYNPAYFVAKLDPIARDKLKGSSLITIVFSNVPPREASIWIRYSYNRYDPTCFK